MHVHLRRALDTLDRATAGLSVERAVRPVEGKWSVVEVLDHLRLAYVLSARALDKVVETGQPKVRRPTMMQRLTRMCVIDVGYFPKARAPEAVTPRGTVPPERIVDATREALVALDGALSRAAERFGEDTPVLNHPHFAGLSVRQWRAFHRRHTAHHLRQARRRRAM